MASMIAMEDNNSSETLCCTICTDTKSVDEMLTIEGCSHSFCADCISQHIAAKLEDHHAAVKCPEPKCVVVLEPEMCVSLVSEEVLDRWGDPLVEAMLVKMNTIELCPFKECSAVMVDDDGEEAAEDALLKQLAHKNKWKRCSECNIYVDKIDGCLHITCMCGSEFCYSCGSKWSEGHACVPK